MPEFARNRSQERSLNHYRSPLVFPERINLIAWCYTGSGELYARRLDECERRASEAINQISSDYDHEERERSVEIELRG
jgi:hypothetical protein